MVDPAARSAEFVALLTHHQQRLFRYIMTFLPRRQDAEDVLQETNAVLWSKASQFESGTSFYTWARAIARFEILEHSRRSSHISFVLDAELLEMLSDEDEDDLVPADCQGAMQRCIEKLSERDRQLLDDCYRRDASVKEVAQRRQRSAGSIYRSLERIRMTLLECINRSLAREERMA